MTEHRNPPMPADEMRDRPDLVRQQRDHAEGRVRELEAELEHADRFGRGEFRVTQWAYDRVVHLNTELRARDEAAKAVVQAWRERIAPARTQRMEHLVRAFIGNELANRLDALAHAHEDGGQDR